MAGLLTRPSVLLTVAMSFAVVLSPYWAAITLLKHEPSAHSLWQKTMLGFVWVACRNC